MVINIKNLSLQLGKKTILNDINLSIAKGEMIGLIGPNGAGKTSLLKVLAHLHQSFSGEYLLHNKPINTYSLKALSHNIGYLAQDAQAHWPLKVKTLIELGRLPYQGFFNQLSAIDQQAITHATEQTEVSHLLERVITELSGGEKARVFLARLLAANPSVIFLDEPIAALDPYHQLHIMEILKNHTTNGGTIVVILHDLNLATRFCDKLVLMDKGSIIKEGSINQLLENQLLEETYGIELKLFCENDAFSLTPWKRKNN